MTELRRNYQYFLRRLLLPGLLTLVADQASGFMLTSVDKMPQIVFPRSVSWQCSCIKICQRRIQNQMSFDLRQNRTGGPV